jgi:pimeloyl-ACP methyl ester carboxylesterase
MRAPTRSYWGWNARAAQRITVPTLIMIGEADDLLASNRALFGDLATADKAMVEIACGSHFMLWENRHKLLHEASADWLRQATFRGRSTGRWRIDAAGSLAALN